MNKIELSVMPGVVKTIVALVMTLAVMVGSAPAAIIPIYSHNFDGGTGNLNGATVDVGTGSWTAANVVNQNGDFTTGAGSATLPFTPDHGWLYELDARVRDVSGDGNWIALGFANAQSSSSGTNNRFITGNVVGTAWMFVRGDASVNANQGWLGAGNLGGGNHGTTDGQAWTGALANANPGGDVDMRILLDTTGGSGAWTATWLAKRPTETDYTVVRPATSVLNESNFTSVGFAFANAGVSGSIESFSLTQVPEPGAAMLLVSTLVCGLLWRHRRGKK